MDNWTLCKDAMPNDDEEVLFAVAYPWDRGKKPKVMLGRHHTNEEGRGWWTNYFSGFADYEVCAWTPLPDTESLRNL